MKRQQTLRIESLEDRKLLTTTSLVAELFPDSDAPQHVTYEGRAVATSADYHVASAPLASFDGVGSAGVVNVYDAASDTLLFTIPNPHPDPEQQFRFGQSVALDGDRLVVGAPENRGGGDVYVFDLSTANPTVPIAELINPSVDSFGTSVDISGTRIVVGAPRDDGGGLDQSGRAFIYDISLSTQRIYSLFDPSRAAFNLFGESLAIEGDTILVGSGSDVGGVQHAGSVQQYDLSTSTPWFPVGQITDPTPEVNERFGQAIDISGNRAIVGAPNSPVGSIENSGSAMVFDLDDLNSGPIANLQNPFPAQFERFGWTVAIADDTAVVSGSLAPSGVGIVYVYDLASATPSVEALRIANPSPDIGDGFRQVAISNNELLVGAAADDTLAVAAGGAYTFDLAGPNPFAPSATLRTALPAVGEGFGNAADVAGDFVAVATRADSSGREDAVLRIYDATSGTPDEPILTIESPYTSDTVTRFADTIAFANDEILAVGTDRNEVLLYDVTTSSTSPLTRITPPEPNLTSFGRLQVMGNGNLIGLRAWDSVEFSNEWFVYDVADPLNPIVHSRIVQQSGDLADLSGTTLVIADSNGQGTVSVYDLSSATPQIPVHVIDAPAADEDEDFAETLQISGSTLVVGASGTDNHSGIAHVYDLSSTTPTVPAYSIDNPTGLAWYEFGDNLALDGNLLAVAAPRSHADDLGTVYLYDLGTTTPTIPEVTLFNRTPERREMFGLTLAVDGGRVLAGTPRDNTENFAQGSVEVWDIGGITPTDPVNPPVDPPVDPPTDPPSNVITSSFPGDLGTIIDGSHSSLFASDDNRLEYVPSGAGVFAFDVPTDASDVTLFIEHSLTGTDDFWVTYSNDGGFWYRYATSLRSQANDGVTTLELPEDMRGEVLVRIRDSNPATVDTLSLDQLVMETASDTTTPLPEVGVTVRGIDDVGVSQRSVPEIDASVDLQFYRTAADYSQPLSVRYEVSGSAIAGADYDADLTGTVVIPANRSSVSIPIQIVDDAVSELDEDIVVRIIPDVSYDIDTRLDNDDATITILANDDPVETTEFISPRPIVNIISGTRDDLLADDGNRLTAGNRSVFVFDDVSPGGETATLFFEAQHSSPDDQYWISYSTDGDNYQFATALGVDATSDTLVRWELPSGVSGEVSFLIVESNSAIAHPIAIDRFVIEQNAVGDPGPDPDPNPDPDPQPDSNPLYSLINVDGLVSGDASDLRADDGDRLAFNVLGTLQGFDFFIPESTTSAKLVLEAQHASSDDFWISYCSGTCNRLDYLATLGGDANADTRIEWDIPDDVRGNFRIRFADSNPATVDQVMMDLLKIEVS